MKLVFKLVVLSSFNHTLSEVPYKTMEDCREMARLVNLPYIATCIPKLVDKLTKTFEATVKQNGR